MTNKNHGDTIACNAAISACDRGNQWQLAVALLSIMAHASVASSITTYNDAISACEKGKEWQLALAVLEGMAQANVLSDTISYSAVISNQ